MRDHFMHGEPQIRRMQQQVIATRLHRLGAQLLHRQLRPLGRAFGHLRVDHPFVAQAHRRDLAALHRLEVGEIGRHRRDRHTRRRAIDRLHEERSVAGHERLLFAQEEHAGGHVANALHAQCGFVGRQQQRHLVRNRHIEWVRFDGALPLAHLIAGRGGELHGAQLAGAVGAGLFERRAGGVSHRVLVEAAGGREAPCAVHQRAHAESEGVGVADALHDAITRVHVLLAAGRHAHVGVRGAAGLGDIERRLHEGLDGRIVGRRQVGREESGGGDQRAGGGERGGRSRSDQTTGGHSSACLEEIAAGACHEQIMSRS